MNGAAPAACYATGSSVKRGRFRRCSIRISARCSTSGAKATSTTWCSSTSRATLADRLARTGPIAVADALKIAVEVCDALDKAHRSGIVHRDLKPANVILTKAGAKLLDFGLAKAAAPVVQASSLSMLPPPPPTITARGTILGTFQYMAPEQIEGLEADTRTDIFAFGALLFEMLTGRPAFEGKTRARLTFDPTDDSFPVWSPDGEKVAFMSLRQGEAGIRVASAAPGAADNLVLKITQPVAVAYPTDWSRDGRFIAYTQGAGGNGDVWILPLQGDRKPFPLANSSFAEDAATFSPDGRWIAYSSNESGQFQVYVQPFPPAAGKYQISRNGGAQPMWRGDGRELFFIAPDSTMMAAQIDTARGFEAGVPQTLFASRAGTTLQGRRQYAVTGDGKRISGREDRWPTAAAGL